MLRISLTGHLSNEEGFKKRRNNKGNYIYNEKETIGISGALNGEREPRESNTYRKK